MEPPNLSQLSHAQKDELILALWPLQQQVRDLSAQLEALQKQVAELQGRLKRNSTNSNQPPGSDGLNKPDPKSLRAPTGRSSGGQKGHPGRTLSQAEKPEHTVVHPVPTQCDACLAPLGEATLADEVRQVFELPVLQFEVTEHRVAQVRCSCGKNHRGQFPKEVAASVQYGPAAQAAMVHLNHTHMVPLWRTAQLMEQFFGLPVSQAAVCKAGETAQAILQPAVDGIGQAIVANALAHADETGMRVAKKLHWLHVLATDTLTWMACHPKRGAAAFADLQLLQQFKGTLVHDGWIPYRALGCLHALCNAHHLRELVYLVEQHQQDWAADMIELLTHANHVDNTHCINAQARDYGAPEYMQEVSDLRNLFEAILDQGEAANPRALATGQRGRAKQSKARNLIERLRLYGDDVWRFMTDPGVPFTNNIAEQAVRMPKVKQKISGGFRTKEGVDVFCTIRSYVATMHKQGANIFEALIQAFRGTPPQPNLG